MSLRIFVSSTSGSMKIKEQQAYIKRILDGLGLAYEEIDISDPKNAEAKAEMQEAAKTHSKSVVPPHLLRDNNYIGDGQDFYDAVEDDNIEVFLQVPGAKESEKIEDQEQRDDKKEVDKGGDKEKEEKEDGDEGSKTGEKNKESDKKDKESEENDEEEEKDKEAEAEDKNSDKVKDTDMKDRESDEKDKESEEKDKESEKKDKESEEKDKKSEEKDKESEEKDKESEEKDKESEEKDKESEEKDKESEEKDKESEEKDKESEEKEEEPETKTKKSNSKLQEKKYADPKSNETASVFIIPAPNGNVATSYENLGSEYETDKCCRDHDTCPHSITALQTRYGLKNPFLTTLSECECDVKFYFCLKQAAQMSATAQFAVKMFFETLRMPCFQLVSRPVCQSRHFLFGTCQGGVKNRTVAELRRLPFFTDDLARAVAGGHLRFRT
uniref:PA2c domain-containing protein n=1 Tax=Macrostomum lignano TaxID=282301 RepID=A0A1I8GQG4_9PLAT